jgi:hypothetical protein
MKAPCDRCGHGWSVHNRRIKDQFTTACSASARMPKPEPQRCPCDGFYPEGFAASFPKQPDFAWSEAES